MNILITGGGPLASQVAKIFVEKDYSVLMLDKNPDPAFLKTITKSKTIKLMPCDITKKQKLFELFHDFRPTTIIHTAALAGHIAEEQPTHTIDVNIKGTLNACEAMSRYEVESMVFSSSLSVYDVITNTNKSISEEECFMPRSLYGITKSASELILKMYHEKHGLKTKILRFAGMYGSNNSSNGGRMGKNINMIIAAIAQTGKAIINSRSLGANEYLYVKDAASSVWLAHEKNLTSPLNIGTGKTISASFFVNTLLEILPFAEIKINDDSTIIKTRPLDISKAKKILDYTPKFDLKTGLEDYISYMEENGLKISWLKKKNN